MTAPANRTVHGFLEACSLEVGAKAMPALRAEASRLAPGTTISIPYLPGEDDEARLAAARSVHALGLQPVPHLSARYICSPAALTRFITRAVNDAGVTQCLLVAGDRPTPAGPFADSSDLLQTGLFERAGLRQVAVAGHPGGHPVMGEAECWEVLARKCDAIAARGMTPLLITQFEFDADVVLAWLDALRSRGLMHPVRVGVPGPASVARLLRYAALCGVGASAAMLARYGVSLGRLLGTAGPEVFVDRLVSGLSDAHGEVSPHFYPFGGVAPTLDWVARYRLRDEAARSER